MRDGTKPIVGPNRSGLVRVRLLLLLLLGPSSTSVIASTETDPRLGPEDSLALAEAVDRAPALVSKAPVLGAFPESRPLTGFLDTGDERDDERTCPPSADPLLVPLDGQLSWPDGAATDDSSREGTGDRDLSLPPASLVPSRPPPVPIGQGDVADDDDGDKDKLYWQTNLFMRIVRDQPYLVTKWWPQEFHRTGFSIPLIAGVLAASTSNQEDMGFDRDLSSRADGGGGARSVSHAFSALGEVSTAALFLGGTYLAGRIGRNDRLSETTSLSAEALIDAGLWISLLKTVTSRTRPSGGAPGSGKFFSYNPQNGEDNRSFPSGHAMGSFALATVFAHQYPEKRWVSWVFYGAAGLIGVSRVTLGRHYPSDVLVGAILGNSIGRMVVARGSEGRPLLGMRLSFAGADGLGGAARQDAATAPPRPRSTLQPYYDTDHQAWGLAYTREW